MVDMPFEGRSADGPIRVGFTTKDYGLGITQSIVDAVETAARLLDDAGYIVEEVETPPVDELAAAAGRIFVGEAKMLMEKDFRKYGSETFQKVYDSYGEMFGADTGEDYVRTIAYRNHLHRQWNVLLAKYPLMKTPYLLGPLYAWNRDEEGAEGAQAVLGNLIYSYSFNYLGLPAAIISTGVVDNLPVGVQIVGRRFREDQCLDAAEIIESSCGIMAQELWRKKGELA